MTHRKALRDAGRAAMATAFPVLRRVSQWALPTNAGDLPAWSLSTPQERSGAETKDSLNRAVTVLVVVKREAVSADDGGLEDALDADAALVEAQIVPALQAHCRHAELSETVTDLASEGRRAVGQIILRITCTLDTDTP